MGLHLIAEASFAESLFLNLWVIFKVAAGLGFVVFVHELGHFLVAKACGVKCEKFYVGFDVPINLGPFKLPSSLWRTQWGETEYGIGILPLGGYVKMLGQDDNPAHAAEEAERIRLKKSDPDAEEGDESEDGSNIAAPDEPYELDPRSYPAKSVPARMAIISAGVIMNLIFAVIFAAVAYRVGMEINPAEVGGTVAGDPAWIAGLKPGDKFLEIGTDSPRSEFHRFFGDLNVHVMLNGSEKPMPFLVRGLDGTEKNMEITPSSRNQRVSKNAPPAIGVLPSLDLKVYGTNPGSVASSLENELKDEDEIVSANGKTLTDIHEFIALLANQPREEIAMSLHRWPEGTKDEDKILGKVKPETIEVTLPAAKAQTVGLAMDIGPIVAIQNDSPAAAAGLKEGDIIQSVAGQEVTDPMRLPSLFDEHLNSEEPIELVVKRGDSTETIAIKPQPRKFYSRWYSPAAPIGLESIGVAIEVGRTVRVVTPGSGAAEAGMQPGDKITNVAFEAASKEAAKQMDEAHVAYKAKVELNDQKQSWPYVHSTLQTLLPDTKVEVTFERDGKSQTATMTLATADDWYVPERGVMLYSKAVTHQVKSWSEAWRLGFRETKERSLQVLGIVKRLVTGEISLGNLSGPFGIIKVAGSAASQGIPALLIFLTMLSANLAVLNFLPIPALDGGHMVFLLAEGVRGKPVDEAWQTKLSVIGISFLLLLMIFATFMDVGRFFGF